MDLSDGRGAQSADTGSAYRVRAGEAAVPARLTTNGLLHKRPRSDCILGGKLWIHEPGENGALPPAHV